MTSNSDTLLKLQAITKVYGMGEAQMFALRGISLNISQGEFVAVMGPSGSGKSTCMNILGCMDQPSHGHYWFRDVNVGILSRNQRTLLRRHFLGFVFQGFNLLNRTSALENVELPLLYRGVGSNERRAAARLALATVGLSGWETHKSNELSGGQQQRVAIARALATEPSILMGDEPTGNLDSRTSREVIELFRKLNEQRRLTVILVTHDLAVARNAKRNIVLRDGKIIADTLDHDEAALAIKQSQELV